MGFNYFLPPEFTLSNSSLTLNIFTSMINGLVPLLPAGSNTQTSDSCSLLSSAKCFQPPVSTPAIRLRSKLNLACHSLSPMRNITSSDCRGRCSVTHLLGIGCYKQKEMRFGSFQFLKCWNNLNKDTIWETWILYSSGRNCKVQSSNLNHLF